MTPADERRSTHRRTHRLAWITAALLSAVLVVAPATWQAWSWGNTRSGTLHGASDGRPVTALEIVGGDADITVTPARTTRSATRPPSAGPSSRRPSSRAGSATPCG